LFAALPAYAVHRVATVITQALIACEFMVDVDPRQMRRQRPRSASALSNACSDARARVVSIITRHLALNSDFRFVKELKLGLPWVFFRTRAEALLLKAL